MFLFFRIVNQVLVRLWMRRTTREVRWDWQWPVSKGLSGRSVFCLRGCLTLSCESKAGANEVQCSGAFYVC